MQAPEKALQQIQEQEDREALRKIAKAFNKDEWATVLNMVPSEVLASELVKRATAGERAMKKIKEAWEEETRKWN